MNDLRFLQIHTLTPYAASLLNRDDVGMAKRLPFGGAERVRISSQCLKRHWRRAVGEWSLADLDGGLSLRSREIFSREIAPRLLAEGVAPAIISAVLEALKAELLGESAKAEKARKAKGDEADELFKTLKTEQVIVLGRPEINFITQAARQLAADATSVKDAAAAVKSYLKTGKANLAALKRAAGLDAALFGRMVTSDILARGDAAVHVAHAFTVHAAAVEPDYFSAVDDLVQESGELGAGHINHSELSAGLFYGYVVIDLPLLVSNLEGCARADWLKADRGLAGRVVTRLLHLIAEVSPGAKLGSTAPYGYAELMLVEAGNRQPRSLANAFLKAVPMRSGGDLRQETLKCFSEHLSAFDGMYGAREQRRYAALTEVHGIAAERTQDGLDGLAGWATGILTGAPA